MKYLDILAAVLLVIGGLAWGIFGLFEVNIVSSATGSATGLAQFVYVLVGLSALYQALGLRAIQRRWDVSPVTVS